MFTQDVPENTIALEYCGEIISEGTARRRLELNSERHTYACLITAGWAIDGRHYGSEARFINSSHEPNCVLETWWVGNTPHVVVRTPRALKAGEEILVYYNFSSSDKQKCLCGAETCTGWIGTRSKQSKAPEDPSWYDEPESNVEIQPTFSRSMRRTLREYGLTAEKVIGDGHCLFHSIANLEPSLSSKEWRSAIIDDIERHCVTEELRRVYLLRANHDVRAGRVRFQSFDEMVKAFRSDEWGNADCIRHAARLLRKGILVFTQGSTQNYYRWEEDQEPSETLILYNSTCPATGKLVHFDPCRHQSTPREEFRNMLIEKKAGLNRAIAGGELELSDDEQVHQPRTDQRQNVGAREAED
eukprot:409294-Rhodomonas_salina.1